MGQGKQFIKMKYKDAAEPSCVRILIDILYLLFVFVSIAVCVGLLLS